MGEEYKDFVELDVWKLAHELRLKIYVLDKFLPEDEKYGIRSQIKRSAQSVPANIAEGHGRYHFQENIQFCRQARGSLLETKDYLLFIRDAEWIQKESSIETLLNLINEIHKKLNGYISYLKKQKEYYQ